MVLNASDPHGSEASAPGHRGLYGLFWRFAGDACVVQPDIANMARGGCTLQACPGCLSHCTADLQCLCIPDLLHINFQ
jgi:hypothetical protein